MRRFKVNYLVLLSIIFTVGLHFAAYAAANGRCAKQFSAGRSYQTPANKLAASIEASPHHLLGVFQPYDTSPRDVPKYVEKLFKNGRILPFEKFKKALKSIDRDVFKLTSQIVTEANLAVYMRTRSVIRKSGVFKNSWQTKGIARPQVLDNVAALYGVADHREIPEKYWPHHAFLWFRKMPKGMKIEDIYPLLKRQGGAERAFGGEIYQIHFEKEDLKSRTLYTIGDFDFSGHKNRIEADRRNADKPLSVDVDPMALVEGSFPITDLRGLFLYVFNDLKASKDYHGEIPNKITMPANAVIEVTIWGPLKGVDATHQVDDSFKLPNVSE